MQKSDDITALYDQFGGNPDHFQEIGRADRTYAARSRWPLFAHLAREQGLEVPPTLDNDPEAFGHAPVAQPSRDFQQQAVPQRTEFKADAPAPEPAPEPAILPAKAADTASVWSIRGSPSMRPTRPSNTVGARVLSENAPVAPVAQETRREPSWLRPRAAAIPEVNVAAAPQVAPARASAAAPTFAPVSAPAPVSPRFAAPAATSLLAGVSPLRRLARPESFAPSTGDNSRNAPIAAPTDDLASVFSRLSDGGYGGERNR